MITSSRPFLLPVLSVIVILLLLAPATAQESTTQIPDNQPGWLPGETTEQHNVRMAWWRDAKFGMFIQWGLYCIPADGEWHMRQHQEPYADYSKLAAQFNPAKFDADAWTGLAHEAGMKYLVLTTNTTTASPCSSPPPVPTTWLTQRPSSAMS